MQGWISPISHVSLMALLFALLAVPCAMGLHVVQPEDGAVVHEVPVLFGWDCQVDADYFIFTLGDSEDFSGQYMQENLTDAFISMQALTPGDWYWEVEAYKDGEPVAQSGIHSLSFRTVPDGIQLDVDTAGYQETGMVSFSIQPLDYGTIMLMVAGPSGEIVHASDVSSSPVDVALTESGDYRAWVNGSVGDISHTDSLTFSVEAPADGTGDGGNTSDDVGVNDTAQDNATQDTSPDAGPFTLSVNVYGVEGPVEDANLSCAVNLSALSDDEGEASLGLEEGSYSCSISAEGYEEDTFDLDMDGDREMDRFLSRPDDADADYADEGNTDTASDDKDATGSIGVASSENSSSDGKRTAKNDTDDTGDAAFAAADMHQGVKEAGNRKAPLQVEIVRGGVSKVPPVDIAYEVSREAACELLISREDGSYEIVDEDADSYGLVAGVGRFTLYDIPHGSYHAKVRCDGEPSDPITFSITGLSGQERLDARIKRLKRTMNDKALSGLSSFNQLSESLSQAKRSLKGIRANLKNLREAGNVSGYRSALRMADAKSTSLLEDLPVNITVRRQQEEVFYLPQQGFSTMMDGYLRSDPVLVRETRSALYDNLPDFQEHFVASRRSKVICVVYGDDKQECNTLVTKEVRPENQSIRRSNVILVEYVPGEVLEVHGAEELRDGYLKGDMGVLSIMYVLGGKVEESIIEETRTLVSYHHELSEPPVVTGMNVARTGPSLVDFSTILISIIIIAVVGVGGLLFVPGSPACVMGSAGSPEERLQHTLQEAITLMEREGAQEALPHCSRSLSLFERLPPERKGAYMELMQQVALYLERFSLEDRIGQLLEKLRFQEQLAAFDTHLFEESEGLFSEIQARLDALPHAYRNQLSEKIQMVHSLRAKIRSRMRT